MTDTTDPTNSAPINAPAADASGVPLPVVPTPPQAPPQAPLPATCLSAGTAALPVNPITTAGDVSTPEIPEVFRRRGLEALLTAPSPPPVASTPPAAPMGSPPLCPPEAGQVYRLKDVSVQRATWVEVQAAAKFWRPDTTAHRRDVVVHTPLKGLDVPTFFGAEMTRMVWVDPIELFLADYERADAQAVSRLLRKQLRHRNTVTGWAVRAVEPRRLKSTPLSRVESEDQLCVVKCAFPTVAEEQGVDCHFWRGGEIHTWAGKSPLVIPAESCLDGGFIHVRREEARAAKAAYVRAKGLRAVTAAQYWASSGF